MTQMLTAKVLRNRVGGELPQAEREILEAAISEARILPVGHIAVRQGDLVDVSILLVEGFMTRHIDAVDGRRHLVGVHVPGDFVDLHAYPLKRLDHDVAALTAVTVGIVRHSELARIQDAYNHLTRRLWFLTLLDAAVHRQWVYRLSSLNALARIAHFLCEMNARLLAVGMSDGSEFELPMTQVDFGEVCSLTNVHVNRVFRQLREMSLCSIRHSKIHIQDVKALATLGQFDPMYLYLNDQVAALAAGLPCKAS